MDTDRCRRGNCLGADLQFKIYDYAGIIPAAVSGDVDAIMANLNVTPERKESLPFSEDLMEEPIAIMVRDDSAENGLFFDYLKSRIEKNFIKEDRWKLFVTGILTTSLITVLSIIFGTALGFVIFFICKDGNHVANIATRAALWLIRGTPVVVLLMILYYILLRGLNISGVAVSVVAFTLTFGASVYGLLKIGVGAVDYGQYEAAYALGYSVNRTFFRIILPQALPHVMTAYRDEITGLIKATAIVGYIAVQDLTKMGDLIRSRTYEAFFPLIAIAVIYFMLEGIFGIIVKRIQFHIDPKNRKREDILKHLS